MMDAWEDGEEDDEILKEMKERKKQKSFSSVINRGRLDPYELDEVMV